MQTSGEVLVLEKYGVFSTRWIMILCLNNQFIPNCKCVVFVLLLVFTFPKRGLAPLVFFSIRCARGSCIWLKKNPKVETSPSAP